MSSVTCPKNSSSLLSRVALVLVPTLFIAALVVGEGPSLAGRRAAKQSKSRVGANSADQPADGEGHIATRAEQRTTSRMAKRPTKVGAFNPADETVDMFQAIEEGRIAVKLIPKDSTEGRIFIQNKAGKPLNVKLPPAFAARPVLAQMGMMGGAAAGGAGGGQGMGGGGMGMMNVPAEKTNHVKVACVCLEHGKPEPRSKMTYEVKPVESFTTKPGVKEMLVLLGEGKINQRAAQVAAWHLNNGLTWEQLIGKKIEHADGSTEPYFSGEELQAGMAIVSQALADADKAKQDAPPSPGETALKGG